MAKNEKSQPAAPKIEKYEVEGAADTMMRLATSPELLRRARGVIKKREIAIRKLLKKNPI